MCVADVYACLWESCGFESSDSNEIVRHVNFHSYHTKIKCIGSNILARSRLPACTFIQVGKNLVPDLPDPFTCCWDDCERTFNNSQMYFNHVQTHVHCNPRGNNVEGGVPCSWRGCKSVFRSMYKLADHVRSHTQEKLVGCPTCGGLFATKTKFFDHCKRQVPLELQGYQCSHCSKYYPSERLLRDHMRHHVNHYKCSFCDMTCPTPSSLSVHIRYRHLDSKPFKCSFCEYTSYQAVRWYMVPQILTDDQTHRLCIASDLLHNAEMFDRVINGDEAWCLQYILETDSKSMQWKTQNSPRPKKRCISLSQFRAMLVCFFDCRGDSSL
ncbi:histone H4 transcription factor [Cryptotermes secundus]|uniref:histone H4 transcription factor n=1 Tax=Cryptotermes secundus TaxID=105785 RepID=UPI000CD7BB4B|nr:histone H4 transcription factor [Cryptotermes secundus]